MVPVSFGKGEGRLEALDVVARRFAVEFEGLEWGDELVGFEEELLQEGADDELGGVFSGEGVQTWHGCEDDATEHAVDFPPFSSWSERVVV